MIVPILTHEGLWDQKELGQKFEEFIEWNSNIVFRVYFSPSSYEAFLSAEYASTALLFSDSNA